MMYSARRFRCFLRKSRVVRRDEKTKIGRKGGRCVERKSKEPNSLNSLTESGNGGFSLIELLVGISVLAVVGLMITSLFSSSTRLYRSTASYSNIQTESQAVSRKISNAIMGAGSLYLNEGERGSYLFTGENGSRKECILR